MYEKYMKMAIELSKKGIGYTNPNPLVGAIIIKDGIIIGQGYHEYFGGNHAEVNAINNASGNIEGSTMYVTLEPCSHFGKTPPCVNKIIEKKIAKVIIGMIDPNPLVSGNGIRILRENGIEVITGVLEEKIAKLNEIFVKYVTTERPFCIMKYAMTLDGKIATKSGDSKWISNEKSRNFVHETRHKTSAIMVGIGTVLADNPNLTTRLEGGTGKDAIRIIVDSRGRIPLDSNVLNLESKADTIIATTSCMKEDKLTALLNMGIKVIITPSKNTHVDLNYLVDVLGQRGIDSILLEGGANLNYSALEAGIVDKVMAFISPKLIGGSNALTPVGGEGKRSINDAVKLNNVEISRFEDDLLVEGYIYKEVKLCSQD